MNRSLFDRWLSAGALVAVALLVLNVSLTYHNTRRLHQQAQSVAHPHDVIQALDNVLSLMKDAETGQRDYLIIGDDRYLQPYDAAVGAIERQVDVFQQLTLNDAQHQQRLPELRLRIAAKLDELHPTIALRKSSGFDAVRPVVLSDQGKAETDALRALVGQMASKEEILRAERVAARDHAYRLAMIEGLLSGACAILAVGALLALLRRHLKSRHRATFIIAEQSERLRTTLASIGDGVIATDVHGHVTMMNPVSEALTGWTFADAKGQPLTSVFRIVNETTRREVENPALRALREGVIVGLANHTILIAKDGSERAIDDSASPIRCAMGELVGCVLAFRDVGEQRRAARQLAESEARKTAMFHAALDCIITINDQGMIIEFNPAAEQTFGYRRDDVLGKELGALIIPPAYRERHRQGLARYLATGEWAVLNQRLELSALRADGSEFPVELTVTQLASDGPPLFTAYLRDITERKAAEQAIRAGEERMRLMADAMPQLAWMANPDGFIHWYNRGWYEYTGTTPDEMQGWGWRSVHDPNVLADVMKRWTASIASGQPFEMTFPLRSKDGSFRHFLTRVRPSKDPNGNVLQWFGTNTDITEQLAAEENVLRAKEAAETASIAKDNFLATLSHELRTPLTPVLATLGAWEQAREFPPELQEDLQMVRRNVDLEARLIDDLLDLTRIVKGKIALHLEVMDVQKLLDSVVGMYKSEINAKRIDLSLRPAAAQCHVRADPGRLQQAFWNLLKNAVKFTPEGGAIEITTRNDAHGHIQIVVTDTGIGMSADMIKRLFTPFEQETAGRYGGLGLGLAITKTLLSVQDGLIEANSEGAGRGATFIITLPCVDPPRQSDPAPYGAKSSENDNGLSAQDEHKNCYRVLLVEDHADTARVLSRLLRGNGHEVSTAYCVADALAALRSDQFDILLSDIGLPDGTGIDLIREVRQQYGHKMPAVALTGFGMEDDVTRTIEAGFNSHLTKPVNFARLEQTIQQACKGDDGIACPE